jgi:hypothetical protein
MTSRKPLSNLKLIHSKHPIRFKKRIGCCGFKDAKSILKYFFNCLLKGKD